MDYLAVVAKSLHHIVKGFTYIDKKTGQLKGIISKMSYEDWEIYRLASGEVCQSLKCCKDAINQQGFVLCLVCNLPLCAFHHPGHTSYAHGLEGSTYETDTEYDE